MTPKAYPSSISFSFLRCRLSCSKELGKLRLLLNYIIGELVFYMLVDYKLKITYYCDGQTSSKFHRASLQEKLGYNLFMTWKFPIISSQ